MASQLERLAPARAHLDADAAAAGTGWSPFSCHAVSAQHLAARKPGADGCLADLVRIDGVGVQPDRTTRPKAPPIMRWIWDGAFVGVINLRWQPGERPPSLSGHVGAAVAPWTQRRGHATEGLRLMPGEAQAAGLGLAEITPDPSNSPSQEPIRRCGGVQVATRDNPFTGSPTVHARIDLAL